ncbi:MAG: DNA polymerase IV [Ignavibacteriae bacterium HGW-Ignavibacteriae-2]|jgi:DNA polymerase-4|nr:MAG: DNA polymerase IV [Ignavibacteriae bacterium HGW-Ignavibacteriae-2]
MRTIFHLDLDAFFVSVERVINPALNGKPVIIGANPEYGRGVVAACSYEAREYGLHSAMPIKQAFRLCPNGIYLHGHHKEYSRFSKAVKHILEKYAPAIEQASIDEFYMDFTGCAHIYGSLFIFAQKLQNEIWQQLSLPCSIGIARNKTIAKIASDFMKPRGITYVLPEMEKAFLAPMPAESMPGIGKETIKSLHDKGFYTLGDIAATAEDYFAAAYGKHGLEMWRKSNGEGSQYLNTYGDQKSMSHEKTFGQDVLEIEKMETTLFTLTAKVCQQLRENNWQAGKVSLKLRYSDFVTLTRDKSIKPTDDDKIVYDTILDLFRKNYTRRVAVRLLGVKASKFNIYCEQEQLFDEEGNIRKRMLRAITDIRDRFGFESIKFARQQ